MCTFEKHNNLGLSEPKKLNFLTFYIYEHYKFHAQRVEHEKKFYNLGARFQSLELQQQVLYYFWRSVYIL